MPPPINKSCVGKRVQVKDKGPGILSFYGQTTFESGTWCGVWLDEPNGKCDGSVKGTRYFKCPAKNGIFVPPTHVTLLLKDVPQQKPAAAAAVVAVSSTSSSSSTTAAAATTTPAATAPATASSATPATSATPTTAPAAAPTPAKGGAAASAKTPAKTAAAGSGGRKITSPKNLAPPAPTTAASKGSKAGSGGSSSAQPIKPVAVKGVTGAAPTTTTATTASAPVGASSPKSSAKGKPQPPSVSPDLGSSLTSDTFLAAFEGDRDLHFESFPNSIVPSATASTSTSRSSSPGTILVTRLVDMALATPQLSSETIAEETLQYQQQDQQQQQAEEEEGQPGAEEEEAGGQADGGSLNDTMMSDPRLSMATPRGSSGDTPVINSPVVTTNTLAELFLEDVQHVPGEESDTAAPAPATAAATAADDGDATTPSPSGGAQEMMSQVLDEREHVLADMAKILDEEGRILDERLQEAQRREEELDAKGRSVDDRERAVREAQQSLDARAAALEESAADLHTRTSALAEREERATRDEAGLKHSEEALRAGQQQLQAREAALAGSEEALRKREEALQAKEAAIRASEQTLQERARQQEQQERAASTRAQAVSDTVVKELEASLAAKARELAMAQDALARAREELAQATEARAQAQEALAQVQGEFAKGQEEAKELRNSVRDLKSEKVTMQAKLASAATQLEEIKALKAKMHELQAEKEALSEQLEANQRALSSTIKDMESEHTKVLDELQGQLARAKIATSKAVEEASAEYATKAARSERQVVELQRRIAAFEASTAELEAKMKSDKDKANAEINALDTRLQSQEAEFRDKLVHVTAEGKAAQERLAQQHTQALDALRQQLEKEKADAVAAEGASWQAKMESGLKVSGSETVQLRDTIKDKEALVAQLRKELKESTLHCQEQEKRWAQIVADRAAETETSKAAYEEAHANALYWETKAREVDVNASSMVESLESETRSKAALIADLERKVQTLTGSNKDILAQLERKTEEAYDWEQRVIKMQHEYTAYMSAASPVPQVVRDEQAEAEAARQRQALEEQLAASRLESQTAMKSLADTRAELAAALAKSGGSATHAVQLQGELDAARAQMKELQKQLTEARAATTPTAMGTGGAEELEELRKQLVAAKRQAKDAEAKCVRLEESASKDPSSLQAQMVTMTQDLESAKFELESMRRMLEKKNAEQKELRSKINLFEQKSHSAHGGASDEAKEDLEAQLEALRAHNDRTSKEVARLQGTVKQLEERNQSVVAERDELRWQVSNMSGSPRGTPLMQPSGAHATPSPAVPASPAHHFVPPSPHVFGTPSSTFSPDNTMRRTSSLRQARVDKSTYG